jgi:tetratricopeptide (TPR) repeat protein
MRVPKRQYLFQEPGRRSNPYRLILWGVLVVFGLTTLRSIRSGEIQPLFLPTPTATRSATSYREEGAAFFEAGNLDDAIEAYDDALAVNPGDYIGWTELARIQVYSSSLLTQQRKRDRLAEARASIDQAVTIAPQDSMAQAVRALAYNWSAGAANSLDEAQAFLAEASIASSLASQLDNGNVLALAYQAEILVDQQQYTQAMQIAELAIALDPNSMDARRVYAYVLESSGSYAAAIEEYKLAAEIAPNMTFLYISIGQNYRQLSLYDPALEYFDRAASINEVLGVADPLPYVAIAKTYSRMGEFFAAALNAERAIDIDPTDPDLYGQLGVIYSRSRNYEGSIPVLQCAVSGCSAEFMSEFSQERWTVDVPGLALTNESALYYYTYASMLAALDQCDTAFPILEELTGTYSGDALIMGIVDENYRICELLASRETNSSP